MAKQKIVIDGKGYSLTYSDQADLESKLARIRETGRSVELPAGTAGEAALHGAGQGLTFGFSDELYGGWKKLFGDEDYSVARDRYRSELDALRDEHPAAFTAGEIAGGVVLPGGGGKLALKGASNLSKLGQVGRLAGVGAVTGAAGGAGYSEGETAGEVLKDAVLPTVAGAIASPLITAAAPLVTNPAGKVWRGLSRSPEQKADDLLADALTAGGKSADDVSSRLAELGPQATLADISDQTVGLGHAVTDRSNDAGAIIGDVLARRQAGAQRRLVDAIDDAGGVLSDEYGAVKTALKGAKKQHSDVYKTFIKASEIGEAGSQRVKEMLDYDLIRPEFQKANAAYEVLTGSKWNGEGAIPLWIVNKMKKQIDEIEGAALERGSNVRRELANTLGGAKREMVSIADADVPIYAHAREGVRGPARLLESLKTGKGIKPTSEKAMERGESLLTEGMSGNPMSPGEKSMFRLGIANRLNKEIHRDTGPYQDYARRISKGGEGAYGDRLDMLSRSANDRKRLSKLLDAESRFASVNARLDPMAGSVTAHKIAAGERADEALAAGSQLIDAIRPGNFIQNMINSFAMDDQTARIVAQKLTSNPSPKAVRELLDSGVISEDMAETMLRWIKSGRGAAATGGMFAPALNEANEPEYRY